MILKLMQINKKVTGVVIIVFVWELVAMIKILNPIYFAAPIEVFKEALHILNSTSIYLDILHTLKRVLAGLLLSVFIGVPVGIVFGYCKVCHDYFGTSVDFMRSIPPVVFFPLFFIVFGMGDISRIMTAALGTAVLIILIVSRDIMQKGRTRINYFRSLGFSGFQLFRYVIWYEALPAILISIRAASSWVVIIIIVTEMLIGPESGLGARVQSVQITSNIPDLYFTIILIGLIGTIINYLFEKLEEISIYWQTE